MPDRPKPTTTPNRTVDDGKSNKQSNEQTPPQQDNETTISQLRDLVRQFVDERDWRQFHNPKNLAMALTVEAGELMEHFQWLTTEQVVRGDGFDRAAVAEELSDVTAYALAIANSLDIDLASALNAKMVKNRAKYPAPAPGEPPTTDPGSPDL